MQKREILSFLLSSALAVSLFTGCQPADDNDNEANTETVTPFERVAVIDGGDWTKVSTIAAAIAEYVDSTDESTALEYPTNWIVGGDKDKTGATIAAADRILGIPKMYDDDGDGTVETAHKLKVIELCNSAYATQATGTGRFHGPALPCEVSVHYDKDADKIYVDMLNADAIFSLFFTDLSDTEKASLKTVASTVKGEIAGMVEAALDDASITYTASDLGLGKAYSISDSMDGAAHINPYIVYSYKMSDDTAIPSGLDATIAQEIIDIMGGTDETGLTSHANVPGLSSGALWRSGRPAPLPVPGVKIVEACSPKYAKMATSLGAEYVTALPCEIGVFIDEDDSEGKTLKITFLNPTFMFTVMFADALEAMSGDEMLTYSTLPDIVFADLKAIVNAALEQYNQTATVDVVVK